MDPATILLFLRNNWKWIAVVLAIAGLLGYIETIKLERDHYKSKSNELQLQLDTAKKEADAKQTELQANADAITDKYRTTLATANTLVTENAKLNAQNIAKDKELASVKLSLNAIGLFNASKSTEQDSAPETKQGDDGKATAIAEALKESNKTLADLLQVTTINDANHLKCIATVEAWQKFWSDYEASVEAVNAGHN